MIKTVNLVVSVLFASILVSFCPSNNEKRFVQSIDSIAGIQIRKMLKLTDKQKVLFPRTVDKCEKLTSTTMFDWTSGFFAGNLWYEYQATNNEEMKKEAIKWTEKLEPLKRFTDHHDLGFMMYCSYGNAYRLTGSEKYKQILLESAKSLSTRFNPKVGSIKSWDIFHSWNGKTNYSYPVIIDNMINLELLFFASNITGNPYFRNIAMQHADNVIKNQLRKDYSCYHVVCYDSATGKVLAKETAQGYSNNSTWSRGQAWGIYGFTMSYRETKEERYLTIAKKMADYYLNNLNLPEDKIPYWDFNALETGYNPSEKSNATRVPVKFKDASAAAITASALFELSTYLKNGEKYKNAAIEMLHNLASPAYLSTSDTNCGFVLQHCVGSIPHTVEIDVPLIYADYYFLEALNRYKLLLNGEKVTKISGSFTRKI